MEIAEKVGLAVTAVGTLIDTAEVFLPGAIGKMAPIKRKAVFALGTALVGIGLLVIFLAPSPQTAGGGGTSNGNGGAGINNGTINNYLPAKPTTPPVAPPQAAPSAQLKMPECPPGEVPMAPDGTVVTNDRTAIGK